jgi:hypothetical protein
MDATHAFSYVVPRGWVQDDASRLDYGSARLTPVGPPEAASYTQIVLGRLDARLYANAEPDVTKAAIRLASDMGEFLMPNPGTRINQQTIPLQAGDVPRAASYYEVRYNDTTRIDGQIFAAAVGTDTQRFYVVWLGTQVYAVDTDVAKSLAESIRQT